MGVFKRPIKADKGQKQHWYIRFRMNGKDKWESVGEVGIITKTIAQRRLEERKRQVRLGQMDMIGSDIPTLNTFSQDYINYVRDVKKKRSWSRDKELLTSLCKYFGNKKLSEISPKDIEDYKLARLQEVKPSTINRALACLKHLFNIAKRWKKFFGENPVSQVDFFEETKHIERVLTYEEENKLLQCSADHLKPIIICALNTGMRKGEILSLQWTDVDLENNLITIDATNTKSKKTKKIYINSKLRGILLELKLKSGGEDIVFLGQDSKPIKRLRTSFDNACRRANIKELRFHDLRHTAATRMIENGANIVAVSKILGHSTLSMTMRYTHPEESIREALENLSSERKNKPSEKGLETSN